MGSTCTNADQHDAAGSNGRAWSAALLKRRCRDEILSYEHCCRDEILSCEHAWRRGCATLVCSATGNWSVVGMTVTGHVLQGLKGALSNRSGQCGSIACPPRCCVCRKLSSISSLMHLSRPHQHGCGGGRRLHWQSWVRLTDRDDDMLVYEYSTRTGTHPNG